MAGGERSMHLSVSADVEGHRARVALVGDLETATADDLETELSAIIDAGARSMELDLSELDFIDSWGLRVLIATNERLSELQGKLHIVAAGAQTRRLLTMTGLAGMLSSPDAAGSDAHRPADEVPPGR